MTDVVEYVAVSQCADVVERNVARPVTNAIEVIKIALLNLQGPVVQSPIKLIQG